jgi:RNA polymerase sigma factor (sigma-70 family)
MATTNSNIVLHRLHGLAARKDAGSATDRQLLDRFAHAREEAAFAALVRRHGPLVLGVCRRVLHQEQDAEDAFQATFLVLARKADSVRRRASLGSWLYRVAYHLALKARKHEAARKKRETRVVQRDRADPLAEVTARELVAVFDEELQNLSEGERTALVLCYLEGKTRDEAAREAGISGSTLKRRLERGKERMRFRLARRGVALPAALLATGLTGTTRAAVPLFLTASAAKAGWLLATGQPPTGVASAEAIALANEALRTVAAGKLRTVGMLLVAGTLLAISTGLLARWPGALVSAAAKDPPPVLALAAEAEPASEGGNQMTVGGRVLDAEGRPLAGADVAVLARAKVARRAGDLSSGGIGVLGRGKTDAEGRFRLEVARTVSTRFDNVAVVAAAANQGLGWEHFNPDAEKPTVEIRLAPEQVIRSRLVDLQGQPAADVAVRVESVGRHEAGEFKGVHAPARIEDLSFWPKTTITDKEGRFELHGVGRAVLAQLGVRDDRFATQGFSVATDAPETVKQYNARPLEPAHLIEGTVVHADTGTPVPGAPLTVYAARSETDSWTGMDGRADEKGRFRINPLPGAFFEVSAYAPDGEPYLSLKQRVNWPKAAVKQQIELKLPRGVLVHGKVTEAGSGTPLAKATVQFIPRRAGNPNFRRDVVTGWEGSVITGDDGTFALGVLPGPGHLLVRGPTLDYVLTEVGERKLNTGKEGGQRQYAHAVIPLDLKSDAGPQEMAVALTPAVTVKGRILGPDNRPVTEALMISRLHVNPVSLDWLSYPATVRDGRFELHGCDPAKSYPVSFLDAKNKAGVTVELSGKQAGEEVTVRLAPCGAAATRLLDGEGKPLAGRRLGLDLVVTPGAQRFDLKAYDRGEPIADEDYVANIDRLNYWEGPQTDANGRVTLPALIPGATYRIVGLDDRDHIIKCEFQVESGKTLQLPDIRWKNQPD